MFEQTAAVQESMNTEKIHYEAGYPHPPPPTAAVTNDDNNVVSSRCVNHPLFLTSSHLLFRPPPSTPPTTSLTPSVSPGAIYSQFLMLEYWAVAVVRWEAENINQIKHFQGKDPAKRQRSVPIILP